MTGTAPDGSGQPLLALTDVHAGYGPAEILFGISLEVAAGEVVALVGRNGAGKSTTLKAIMGLVRITGGSIVFRDKPITALPAFRIARRGLGYVPEERRIFTDLTVSENLEVGRRPAPAGHEPWSLERLFVIFPNLADMRNRMASHMSGGEQQMLTIARALMGNPSAVLLDEPSEGIAPVIVDQMAQAVVGMKAEGIGVLLSEQNVQFAAPISDRAYLIDRGEIRFSGSPADVMADLGAS